MLSTDTPDLVSVPFADIGVKRPIPIPSQIGITDGAASYTDGFPPKTFLPLTLGGVPPAGADFNGLLNAITLVQQWQSAGGMFVFDAAFATAVGGYPKGCRLMSTADNNVTWISTVESNVSDPDAGGAGWTSYASSSGAFMTGYIAAGADAVARNMQSKGREVYSVFETMSAALIADALTGTPVLDHTVAVQKAIDYCIANNHDLSVPGLCRITASLNVNRQVDGAAFDSYFTIFSDAGGGFYVNSAINIFSSSIVDVLAPVSQLVRWRNLRFVASVNSLAAYVIDGTKFLRCEFFGCNFSKIKCLLSAKYVQSIGMYFCNARRWSGTFFKASPQGYDIQVIGGMYEAGTGDCFDIASPIGCKFWTQIEGMSGTALILNGAQGVDISTYFEANGLDFDCRTGGLTNNGINIHGSYFSHSNATYSVKWGICFGCSSRGNWHTNNMHDLLSTSIVDINDVAQTSLSNGDAITHIGERQGNTAALTIRGANSADYTVSGLTSKYTRGANRIIVDFVCTLTSTATNPADQIFITAGFPTIASTLNMLCGTVEVVGSATNNGISPLSVSNVSPMRVLSSINVLPANVAAAAWTVRGQVVYQAP